jgi:hypothetical protein
MRRWQIFLLLTAAALVAAFSGHSLFVATIKDLNQHISRCSDESAPQYIDDPIDVAANAAEIHSDESATGVQRLTSS